MLITNRPTEKDSLSPFPFKRRAFTDTNKDGKDIIIGAGATTVNVLKQLYDPNRISVIEADFAFLTRDNKERSYDPGVEDKFVFKNKSSIQMFKQEALSLIRDLNQCWTTMGMQLSKDKDRGVDLPDGEALMQSLTKGEKHSLDFVAKHYEEISLILSNVDIAKKLCIVRSVFPGWWLGSYAGKNEDNYDYFRDSVEVHASAFRRMSKDSGFLQTRQHMFDEMGDPLTTNVGFPFYSSGISAKVKVITAYKGGGLGAHRTYDQQALWNDVRAKLIALTPNKQLQLYLFATGVIRRQQYGYKWAHVMRQTEFGSLTVEDVRGFNTVRMAFLFPYMFNLLLTPLVCDWNAMRYWTPGCYHDGLQKTNRMQSIRDKKLFCLEADYSNYDRFQMLDMMSKFVYLSYKDHPAVSTYILPMFMNTYRNMPLLLPDYNGAGKSVGIALEVSKLGLLSGGKHTAANGTQHNSIINIAGFINNGLMTKKSAEEYLLQYIGGPKANIGKGDEWSHMQSDDTLLLDSTLSGLMKKGKAFKEAADIAGLKSSLGVGDRFLMRHVFMGIDIPVLLRIWQNTLSNETAPDHELKFIVGLANRTEGVLGQKTVDPFGLGKLRSITQLEAYLTYRVCSSLLKFLLTAAHVSRNAVEYLTIVTNEAKRMSQHFNVEDFSSYGKRVTMQSETAHTLDKLRIAYTRALAVHELSKSSDEDETLNNYIMDLKGQINVPSSKFMLEQLMAMSSDIANLVSTAGEREHKFFIKALSEVGVNPFF